MRIPQQVSDRVKEAPAQALRAVFAGIGQVLLTADRVRSRAAEYQRARAAAAAQANQTLQSTRPAQPERARPVATREETRWRSLDQTGNVRLLSRDDYHEPELPQEAAEPEPPANIIPEPEPAPDITPEPEPELAANIIPEPEPALDIIPEPEPEPAADLMPEPIPEPGITEAPEPAAATAVGTPTAQPDEGLVVLPVANYDSLTVPSLRARLRNLDPAQLRVLIDYEKAHAGRADVLTMFERRIAKIANDDA
jgi:outer membrane biosynthesis protein TonB